MDCYKTEAVSESFMEKEMKLELLTKSVIKA